MYIFYVYVTINGSELFKCLFFLLQHLSRTSEIRPKIEWKNVRKFGSENKKPENLKSEI